MEVVRRRENVGRGGSDRCRPRDPIVGGLQGDERSERRDDRDEGSKFLPPRISRRYRERNPCP
jgi:hypothetical protein